MSQSHQASTAAMSGHLLDKRVAEPEISEDVGQPSKLLKFADEVKVDGKTVLNISSDKLFYEEPVYARERRSRWGDPVHRKSRPE